MNAIQVENLFKTFDGKTHVLSDICMAIPQGEIFGFLGPNGAGKTTMVRLLNGVLSANGGRAELMGLDVTKDVQAIHRISGVMTETALPYEQLSGIENLKLFGSFHGMAESEALSRGKQLLDTLELSAHQHKKVKTYSTGMKRRLSIARALLHSPQILFLDEPTSGLDPESAVNVNGMIRTLAKEQGVTVFLCTHQLKYAEDLCSLYGFIDQGRLLGVGTFDELLKQKNNQVYLEVRGSHLEAINPAAYSGLERLDEHKIRLPIENDQAANQLLKRLIGSGIDIFEARQSKWSLEDLYFSYQKAGERSE